MDENLFEVVVAESAARNSDGSYNVSSWLANLSGVPIWATRIPPRDPNDDDDEDEEEEDDGDAESDDEDELAVIREPDE